MRNQQIDLIHLEAIFEHTYENQPPFYDLLDKLRAHHYELINIYDVTKVRGRLMQMDILFVSNSFRSKMCSLANAN